MPGRTTTPPDRIRLVDDITHFTLVVLLFIYLFFKHVVCILKRGKQFVNSNAVHFSEMYAIPMVFFNIGNFLLPLIVRLCVNENQQPE